MSATLNPRTREEILLAKIAGEDVSLSNLTPKTAIGTYEKALEAIATRMGTFAKSTDAPATATTAKAGLVKKAANVAVAAGEAPTKAEFDALISALVTAGIMEAPASNG